MFELYVKIATRGLELMNVKLELGLLSTILAISSAHENFNLRLEDWFNADDDNFLHDFVGILNNIDKSTYPSKNFNSFVPRFSVLKNK